MTTVPVALGTRRARPLISARTHKLLIDYSYLVPAALCMLATVVVPIGMAIKMSLYNDILYKPQDYRFIGLGNYFRLVQDPVFWLSLWNSCVWVFGSVALQFVLGFAAALLLNQAFRAARWCARSHSFPGSSPAWLSDSSGNGSINPTMA